MAVVSRIARQILLANDETATPAAADSISQSTPRTTPSGLASLMAAIQQVLPPTSATEPKSTKQTQHAGSRRPQCTHMHMKRLYGNHMCFVCGKVQSMGWLYACEQDRELARIGHAAQPLSAVATLAGHVDQAELAQLLGMKPDAIQGIRDRDYSSQQVETLIRQKFHVLLAIERTEISSPSSSQQTQDHGVRGDSVIASAGVPSAQASSSGDLSMTPAGTPTNVPAGNTLNMPVKKETKLKKQACNFQVCHPCRPFYQDRLYMSFESVLSGRMPAVTEEETTQLPLLSPSVVCGLGLRKPYQSPLPTTQSFESVDITTYQHDGFEEDTSEWTGTSATLSESESEHIETADPHPCPGAGLCPLWSRDAGCAYDTGFDDRLRALNHGFGPEPDLSRTTPDNSFSRLHRMHANAPETPCSYTTSTASSISLPTPETVPLTPLLPTDETFDDAFNRRLRIAGKAASVCPILTGVNRRNGGLGLGFRRTESSSSLGSEVEVEGGVALTEEAIELRMPDIITDEEV